MTIIQSATTSAQRGGVQDVLRSYAFIEIQTRQAQRLIYGRRAERGKPPIIGLLRFATMLRSIWLGAMSDDPYADWWLIQIERQILKGREHIEALRSHIEEQLSSVPVVNVQLAQSLQPMRIDLNFSNPYAFMGAYLLGDYDALVCATLTARHVGLTKRHNAERTLQEGGRLVRRAYNSAHGYRFLALTRNEIRQETSKAMRAKELLGDLPQEVMDGVLRASYSP